jgi:hypothetical protein
MFFDCGDEFGWRWRFQYTERWETQSTFFLPVKKCNSARRVRECAVDNLALTDCSSLKRFLQAIEAREKQLLDHRNPHRAKPQNNIQLFLEG